MYIYRITNNLNGKAYIGQTVQEPEQRWRAHCCRNELAIGKAIKKYGKENFTFEVLAEAFDMDELNWLEEKFIEKFNTMAPNGYNLREGGKNFRMTEEQKAKLSEVHKGKKLSEEHKRKISKSSRSAELCGKAIICIETGIEFPTIMECSRVMGLSDSKIVAVLKGRRKTHGGFTFAYKEE